MKLNWKRLAAAVCLTTALVTGAFAQAQAKQSADDMLAAINGVKSPVMTQELAKDPTKVKEYQEAMAKANKDRAEMILAFYKAYPEHPETPKLLMRRWTTLRPMGYPLPKESADAIRADIESVLAGNSNEEIAKTGKFVRAQIGMMEAYGDPVKMLAATDEFTKAYPSDPRGASLLSNVAQFQTPEAKLAIYERIAKDYASSPAAKYAKGKVRQAREINKPFALSFTEAVSGKKVDIADYKGKVVVLDFWATWCGPCVAELPKMKKLYADYKDKGLEIIGISLDMPEDKGGLTKLRDFVGKNGMAWPQYYQGNYWDSEFSVSWGINAIPALFLIDQNGNLVDVEARGELEEKVKALIEKGK